MVLLNIATAIFAIFSAFCWFRSVVKSNDQRSLWQKLSLPIDRQLEKVPPTTWNYWAAVWTALAAFSQGTVAFIAAINPSAT